MIKNEMMNSTFKVSFYTKRGVICKHGKMPLVARMTVDNCLVQLGLNVEILPEQWSVKTDKAIESYEA